MYLDWKDKIEIMPQSLHHTFRYYNVIQVIGHTFRVLHYRLYTICVTMIGMCKFARFINLRATFLGAVTISFGAHLRYFRIITLRLYNIY